MFESLLIPIEAMADLGAVPADKGILFTRALRGVDLVNAGKTPDERTCKDIIKALAIAYVWIEQGRTAQGEIGQVIRELFDYIVAKQEPDIRTIAAIDAEAKPDTVDEERWARHVATVKRARYLLPAYAHHRRRLCGEGDRKVGLLGILRAQRHFHVGGTGNRLSCVFQEKRSARDPALTKGVSRATLTALQVKDAGLKRGNMVLPLQHRLVAILAADVVGYSRLMEADEERTHNSLVGLRLGVVDPQVAADHGRVIKNTGDGFLAIFDSARDAIRCALSMQDAVTKYTAPLPPDSRISFRMAVNQSDIIIEDNDIYGDGVNVAARLQAFAEPGGVVVSSTVAREVDNGLKVDTIDLGDLHLRNLARPVRAFAVCGPGLRPRLLGDPLTGSEARPSIAVLPFRKLQFRPEEAYFADGIVDEIIHALASLEELFVVSRGSTLAYSGEAIDARAVGRELGVRYVLFGSVTRSRGRLRIITELSDTESGAVITSQQYEGALADLFELQDKISVHVIKTIAPHVRERELNRTLRKHPQSLTAYDFVLQALNLLYRMDQESFSRARTLLQEAISHDPTYAPAYTYAAYWYILRVGEIGSTDPAADAAAGAYYASAAIQRNEYDALALAIYGHVQSFLLKDYDKAVLYLDRAIAAGPNSAMAWTMSSATCGYIGDGPTAVRRAEQGVRLSPLDAHTFWHEGILAQAHYVNGDYEQAVVWARRAAGRNESIRFTTRTLIASLAALGRAEEAVKAAQHLMNLHPEFRLGPYARRCPFRNPGPENWIAGLRSAGLPE